MQIRKLTLPNRAVLVLMVLMALAFVLASSAFALNGLSPADLNKLRQQMNIPTGKAAGAGLKIPIGISLPMSGGAEEFAGPMSNGVKLGLKMIKEMGGPDFQPSFYDIQMGVAELAVNAVTDMGAKGMGMALVGWTFGAAAQIPGAQKYKILMLDAGGGMHPLVLGADYCWGTRMDDNTMMFAGAVMYAAKTYPDAKTVMLIGQDNGADANKASAKVIEKEMEAANKLLGKNLRYLGEERAAIGTTDFSPLIAKINEKNPDIVIALPFNGNAPILFMKQITGQQPIKAKIVISSDWSEASSIQAGAAWKNYYQASQAFFPQYMVNPFAKAFYKAYKAEFKSEPNQYAAGFFEDCFTLWDLMRRVIAKGGNPMSGEQLQKALIANPSFQSVYNGDANTVGVVHFNTKSHDPIDIPMYLSKNDPKTHTLIPLATFGNYGVNFKMLSN